MPRSQLTDDLRISAVRPLISPAILIEEWTPMSEEACARVTTWRSASREIIHGRDDRLLVLVGPCSIHDDGAALDYARQLQAMAEPFSGELFVVMRTYFEKPRTVRGWKGFINDPHLDESYAINEGLQRARKLLADLTDLGMPAGTEFLDNILPQYISDFVTWAAVGARTAESQIHREFASGCSMPVGFKNSTGGQFKSAVDAVESAFHSHWFTSVTKQGVSCILQTTGNPDCHIILRGGSETGPNYGGEHVAGALEELKARGLETGIMVDCSHANSGKDHRLQPSVAEAVAEQIASGQRGLMGVMLESHIHEGRQDLEAGTLGYGVSITDACMSLEQTKPVLYNLAEAVKARRVR
jgi:3-deoxy-7-phosphoheptulonate synthase